MSKLITLDNLSKSIRTLRDWVLTRLAEFKPFIEVTWSELKTLRDNSQLITGGQYRITDYVTTTTQTNTQSVGNRFDIIVTADDVNVLNENARAIQHTTDENDYFHNSNLAAWEIKYCLDNDTNRFAWADNSREHGKEVGRGVIYYMKDEFNNECPYDFKNIQFARWELFDATGYKNNVEDSNITIVYGSLKEGFYAINESDNEFTCGNNDIFKIEYTISDEPTYCYTFGKDTDYSISGSNYSNVIKEYKLDNIIRLNNIVFLGDVCHSNTFGNDCYDNTFGDFYEYNTFGELCCSNTFGNSCRYNIFGNQCYSNILGYDCESNTFGNVCYGNTFGVHYKYNTFGELCYSNTFEEYCESNTFGNNCYSNTLGNRCRYNIFGNMCRYITFGNNCVGNTFGNTCNTIAFGTSAIVNYTLRGNVLNCTFENGTQYVLVYNSSTSSNIQNLYVRHGVKGNGMMNDYYKAIAAPVNSSNQIVVSGTTTATTSTVGLS